MTDYEENLTENILVGNAIRAGTAIDTSKGRGTADARIIEKTTFAVNTGKVDEGLITDIDCNVIEKWETHIVGGNTLP